MNAETQLKKLEIILFAFFGDQHTAQQTAAHLMANAEQLEAIFTPSKTNKA